MDEVDKILDKYGKLMVKTIQDNLESTGTNATRKTSNSVKSAVEGGVLTVVGGRKYFPTVETGSKPSNKNPSPEYVESISEWAQVRGVQGSPYAIAKSILKNGSKLWQKGGRKDIYSNVLEGVLPSMKNEIASVSKQYILNVIKK